MKFEAVVFDLFGTLVAPYERWPELIPSFCRVLHAEPDSFDRAWSGTAIDRDMGGYQSAKAALRHCVEQLGLAATDELLAEAAALQRHNSRLALERVRPRMLELLASLRESGYRLGLISNCDNDTMEVWPETPFAALFDNAVFSSDAGIMKPDPRIYRLVCDRLGVPPERAIFVDDNPDFVRGAEAIGMTGVWCPDAESAVRDLCAVLAPG